MAWNTGTIAFAAHCPPNMPLQTELGGRPGVSVATNMPLLRSCFAPALFHRKQPPPCPSHVQAMYKPCTSHARAMYKPCTSHAQAMHKPCTSHAQAMHKLNRFSIKLDAQLQAWRSRPLGAFPYLMLDARYEKVRHGGQLLDCAVLIAMGINPQGKRSLLGVSVALSEAEPHWRHFLQSLQQRALHGVQFIVSDDHAGLGAARTAVFPAVPWQRCQFHLQQNAQAYVPRLDQRAAVAEAIRSVFMRLPLPPDHREEQFLF